MPTVFTRIIEGELPGTFVWRDERCVAFLSINPLRPGHLLVVPRQEVDHWIDLPDELADHLFVVARSLARAIQHAYAPTKVGLMIAGLEVPHTHLHVVQIDGAHDLDFDNAAESAEPDELEEAARRIRTALSDLGYSPGSPTA